MFKRIFKKIQENQQRRADYWILMNLSNKELHDMGISRMRKRLVSSIKAGGKGGAPGQWSARKAQMVAKQYKAKGGGYK